LSFGLVLYEMATGRQAFKGETMAAVRDAILNLAPTLVRQLNSEIPLKLEEIINKAIEKERSLRYQSSGDLRADLKRRKRDTDSGRVGVAQTPPVTLSFSPSGPSGRGWSRGAGPGEGIRR
jgi:serine/threonine protein kinase